MAIYNEADTQPLNYDQTSDYDRIRTTYDEKVSNGQLDINEEKEQEIEDISSNMSGSFWSKLGYVTKRLSKNKGELFVGLSFILLTIFSGYCLWRLALTFIYLDVKLSPVPTLVAFLLSALPFLVWAWSTKYALYNFYKIKRMLFRLCIINTSILLWQVALNVELKLLLPFIFLIPVYGGIQYSTVVLSSYMFLVGLFITPCIIVTYKLLTITADEMTDRTITNFFIKNHLPDTRKNKEFAYDGRYIKRQDSFSRTQVIQQDDRFLHTMGLGSTGTGKTSTIGAVVYESDLQQKVYNTDYQKKIVEKYLKEGKAKLTRYFEDIDFNIDYIAGDGENAEEIDKELAKLKIMAASAGQTMFCPNAAYSDELYQIAKAKGFRVNRVDPMPDEKTGKLKDEWIGFNPLYVPIEDNHERYLDKVFTAAKLYSDVNQAVFELSGKGDPYFTSLNRSLSVTASVTLIIAFPHVHAGRYATPEDVQYVINNFEEIRPYRDMLIELYGEKNEAGYVIKDIGKAKVGAGLQFILSRIDRDMLGANAAKISEQATGLRNIIDDSLMNPKIRRILCSQETIDLDRILENGEITLVNFEISLGSDSTGFGMFFLLSFVQAVLRRKGTKDTRIPHFAAIDEAPTLFHPKLEAALTIFRQYRCAMTLFLQSLSQLDKNDTTRYLKQVMIGNCATQIWFGRASVEEMKMVNQLAGREQEVQSSVSTRETALSDENTQMAMSTSYKVEDTDRYSATDVRYRQFLECTVMTVRNSTPLPPFIGKVNFLPKHKLRPVERYVVDWSKYYKEPDVEPEVLEPKVTASTEVKAPIEEPKIESPKRGLLSAGTIESHTKVEDKTKPVETEEKINSPVIESDKKETSQQEDCSEGYIPEEDLGENMEDLHNLLNSYQEEANKEAIAEPETPAEEEPDSDGEAVFNYSLDE